QDAGSTLDFHAGYTQPLAVFLNPFQSFIRNILCDDTALVVHQLCDERRFAAGRGAEIQNRFAGLRSELANGKQRAGVLNVKPAVAKTRQRRQWRMRLHLKDQVFKIGRDALPRVLADRQVGPTKEIATDEIVFHIFVAPAGEQVAGIFGWGEAADPAMRDGDARPTASGLGLVELAP